MIGRPPRIFVLSPAKLSGLRAGMLLRAEAEFDLARRLRTEGATLGEVMTFCSGLYFRGKLAYARAFAAPPPGTEGVQVILPEGGLAPVDRVVTGAELVGAGARDIDADDPVYRAALLAAAHALASSLGAGGRCILLGSIATDRYCGPLLEALGERLHFPAAFVGRGDNSRGGLMLRQARAGDELDTIPVAGAVRRGPRPPRLPRLERGPG